MTLLLSRSEIEKKISYPPLRKRAAKLPTLRCDLSVKLLDDYRASVREKKKALPLAEVEMVASKQAVAAARPSAGRTFDLGTQLAEKGELEDATALLLEAVRMGRDDVEAHATLGDVYRRRGMPQQALKYYTKAIEAAPETFLSGEWDTVRIFKDRAECFLSIAATEGDGEALKAAAREYDKYLLIKPATYDALLVAGKTHLDADNLDRAKELLKQAEALNDEDPCLHFNLGELYERREELKPAKEHFALAVKIDPNFPEPYIAEAERLIEKGSGEELMSALNLYLSVLKLKPTSGEVHIRIADVYGLIGEEYIDSSKAMLSRAVELSLSDDRLVEAYFRLGSISQREARLAEEAGADGSQALVAAISHYSMCLALKADHADALLRRAGCFLVRDGEGDRKAAAGDYHAVVELQVDPAELALPYLFLADWHFDARFAGAQSPLSAIRSGVAHYIASLDKAAYYYARASMAGVPKEKLAAATERVVLATSVQSGFFTLIEGQQDQQQHNGGDAADAGAPAATSSLGGVEPVALTEEFALGVPPLALKLVGSHYTTRRAQEPCAHSELFNELQHGWTSLQGFGAFYEQLASLRASGDPKGKKKKK